MKNDNYNELQVFETIEKDHWEKNWQYGVSMRPLSLLNVFNRDAIALLSEPLRSIAHPTIVEIGFVPGKYLRFLKNISTPSAMDTIIRNKAAVRLTNFSENKVGPFRFIVKMF